MNLLFIDSNIPLLDKFVISINDNTKYIIYKFDDLYENLKNQIENFNIENFNNIGFVFVDDFTFNKKFILGDNFISINNDNNIIENNVTKFINQIITKYSVNKIDFLSCNLLKYPIWKSYFEYLMNNNKNIIVRASDNNTGNLLNGGDWILESTNEDISNLYFDVNLSNWNGLLDGGYITSVIKSSDGSMYACGRGDTGGISTNINYPSGQTTTFDSVYNNNNSYSDMAYYSNGHTLISNVISVAYGIAHSIVLKEDGTVWTVGINNNGVLARLSFIGTFGKAYETNNSTIQEVDNTVCISAGYFNSAIIKSDGTLWVVGNNDYGQLGDGYTSHKGVFTKVNNITNAIDVSCGWYNISVVTADGSVWSCGYNDNGQLGDGTTTQRKFFIKSKDDTNNFINDAIAVSCGHTHTSIIRRDGSVWACGENAWSQFGNGVDGYAYNSNRFVKAKISLSGNPYFTNAKSISSATFGNAIIRNDGTLWSCGSNWFGDVGDNSFISKNIYVQSKEDTGSIIQPITDAAHIYRGYGHYILIKTNGTVWTCGYNNNGQLGNGNTTNTPIYKPINLNIVAKYSKNSQSNYNIDGNSFITTFNINNNVSVFFPNTTTTVISSSNISNNNTDIKNTLTKDNKLVIEITPHETTFSDYISYTVTLPSNSIDIEVFFKSGSVQPINKNTDNGSGVYYTYNSNTHIVTIYTKSLNDIGIGYNFAGPLPVNYSIDGNSFISTFNINNTTSVYHPSNTDIIISSSNISNNNTDIKNTLTKDNKLVIEVTPHETTFSDYISYTVTLPSNSIDIEVFFKSGSVQPINKNTDNGSGVYYTYNSNTHIVTIYTKSLNDIGIGYNFSNPNHECFTENTYILTPLGYKQITKLKKGDKIITSDFRIVNIINIIKYECNNSNMRPYIIPKNYFKKNCPSIDTKLSKGHHILYEKKWISPAKNNHVFQVEKKVKTFNYYHIELENYLTDHLIINGGLIVESYGKLTKENLEEAKRRFNNSIILKKYKKI